LQKKKFILDCDPGIDDALAILLLTNSPEISLEAITTVSGNVPINKTSVNALKTLEAIGITNVPVYKGASFPLKRKPIRAYHVHGRDGLGDTNLPTPTRLNVERESAIDFLVRTIRRSSGGEYTLVSTGPLTNTALAIKRYADFSKKLKKLVLMGGAYGVTQYGFGNDSPVAEFNVLADPEAARIVFNSGGNITAVGLDVTTNPKSVMSNHLYEIIGKVQNKRAKFVYSICSKIIKILGNLQLHDPMAAAVAVDPSLAETVFLGVDVETKGDLTLGETVADKRIAPEDFRIAHTIKPNINLCTKIDNLRFLNLFLKRATGLI
jgi:purine nucleosidase